MAASSYSTPSSRWLAVQSRDPLSSEAFVYCVRTTNIYCRPTCAARLARRANVEFCDNAADAEKDGFRPCKRCKPEVAEDWDPWSKIVREACKRIEDAVKTAKEAEAEEEAETDKEVDELKGRKNADSDGQKTELGDPGSSRGRKGAGGWTAHVAGRVNRRRKGGARGREGTKLSELAKGAQLTQSHFHRVFKKVTGMTPKEYRNVVSRMVESGDISQDINQSTSSIVAPADLSEYSTMTPATSTESGVTTPPILLPPDVDEDPEILDIDAFIDESLFEEWTVTGAMAVTDQDMMVMMPYPPTLSRDRTKPRLSRQSTNG